MDSGAIRNYISLTIIERLEIPYRLKESPYPLITILEDPISYKNRVIHIKTKLIKLRIKG